MNVYEVTYDLFRGTPAEYTSLRDFLKKMDSWHDQYSAWYVSFAGSDEDLYALLEPFVGLRDKLKVIRVTELSTKYELSGFEWLSSHGVDATPKK